MNRRQRQVLFGCACAVVAMLIYPPLQFRGYGEGYGWIFAPASGRAINVPQLLVQWLAVGIVGAILLVLASGANRESPSAPTPGMRRVLGIAYRKSRMWRWILLSAIVSSIAVVVAGYLRPAHVVGQILSALMLYAVIFTWHCWIARHGEDRIGEERALSWRRLSIAILSCIILAGAFVAWDFIKQWWSGRVVFTDEQVFGNGGAETQADGSSKPWEHQWDSRPPVKSAPALDQPKSVPSSGAGTLPNSNETPTGYFDDLVPNRYQRQPHPSGKFVPDTDAKK